MTPFLQQVAQHYLEANDLEDYCFVFPNRRSGQFFTHYLQQEFVATDQRPHLMPRVAAINDLLTELTHATTATDIEMLFALYDAYCTVMGDRAQAFDKFIYWAQLIISDFNDIDRSMADAREIYANLDSLNSLGSNYLSPEVQQAVEKVFGTSLFTAFFDTSADADLWQRRGNAAPAAADGVVKQEFLSLWNALHAIYLEYHKVLEGKAVVSPGMMLRMVAEKEIDMSCYTRFVFVGFGVLSVSEVKFFDRFNKAGKADFWWDNAGVQTLLDQAPHDPGALLIDGYCKRFGAKTLLPLDGVDPKIKVVSVASNVGQAKQAFDLIKAMRGGEKELNDIETAIVLPDENLLVPLLHSVHNIGSLNVTLGYPLRSSGIVSLMHIVARMHHQAKKDDEWTYYREDVYDILSHPLIKTYFTDEALTATAQLSRTNRFRVPASEFAGLPFRDLFAPAMDSDEPGTEQESRSRYLDHLLAFSNLLMEKMSLQSQEEIVEEDSQDDRRGVDMPLQQAFLDMYINVLNQLKHSLASCHQHLESTAVFYLIDRLMASVTVPFTGEPLKGLQIMGLLETRSLDFKHVLILSMNERVFPRRRSINSFIPNYIRRAHGMSTIEQQEAIVAFNFYRLLNRASKVTLVYDSSAQKLGSSEPSRYIAQLEKIYGKRLHYVEMNPTATPSPAVTIEVPNSGYDDLRRRYLSHRPYAHEWFLSASAINKYINCPLSFYLQYFQGMSDDNDVSDFMDYGTFGVIVHDTLKDCYDGPQSRARGGLIDRPYIEWFKKNRLDDVVTLNIKKTYLHVSEQDLPNDNQQLRGEAFMLVDTIKSYVNFVLDYDLAKIDEQGPFTIVECERRHELMSMEIGGETMHFTYTPDRIDRLNDGTLRIVDYKTGSDPTTFTSMDDLFDRSKNKVYGEKGRRKAILQLFLYCYAYLLENKDVQRVAPVIYKLGAMEDSGVKTKPAGSAKNSRVPFEQYYFSMDDSEARQFIDMMGNTLNSLFNQGFGQADEGSVPCSHCRFIDFCRRMPPKTGF
jgi:hypothetical protein